MDEAKTHIPDFRGSDANGLFCLTCCTSEKDHKPFPIEVRLVDGKLIVTIQELKGNAANE